MAEENRESRNERRRESRKRRKEEEGRTEVK